MSVDGTWYQLEPPKNRGRITKRKLEMLQIFRSDDGTVYLHSGYLSTLAALIAASEAECVITDNHSVYIPSNKILEFITDREMKNSICRRLKREFPDWKEA